MTREEKILREWEQGQTEYNHPNNRERALCELQESGDQGNEWDSRAEGRMNKNVYENSTAKLITL